MAKIEELAGVFNRERWRPDHSDITNDFVIADLESGDTVKGNAPQGVLIPGLTYRFFGAWEEVHPKYGKSFRFTQFVKAEPHSRFGLVNYLRRFAPNIGPAIATRLFDAFGSDACKILRTDPERASAGIKGLPIEKAREAAVELGKLAELEDTKIELSTLLAGRGFPGAMIDQVIREFGPLAPERIKRDPFTMLVYGFAGCGFARCDRLYTDLGLPAGRIKRQMICLWHALRIDNDGHTWFSACAVEQKLRDHISGAKINLRRAVKLGIKSRWLALHVDAESMGWIAHGEKARNEAKIAEAVQLLLDGPAVLPRFAEAIPA